MPMPTGWDVRCAVRMGCCGGVLRDPWSAGLVPAAIGGRRMIDGRQWSCACSSVQLWAPEMPINAECVDARTGQCWSRLDGDVVVVVLCCAVLGSTGDSIRAAGRWFNSCWASCCWFLLLESKVPVLSRRGKWRKEGPRYPRGKREDRRGLAQKFNEDGQALCLWRGTDTACRAPAQDNVQASTRLFWWWPGDVNWQLRLGQDRVQAR
ncbi:hypothetical protein F5883DRAFT_546581 [Diaporthe sp. PMI_573]|nr:hypothetical protein F5883DRAFT_546581 [Diaporthaceae sp. PMI_573]